MRLKPLILKLHGTIALLTGLLLVIISLTGGAIALHKELDHALNPAIHTVTPQATRQSMDAIVAAAQATHPNSPIQAIQVPEQPNASLRVVHVSAEGRLETFVNPYTTEVLGSRIWEHSLMGFLYTLHHDLFLGKTGEYLVGITGIALLLVVLAGCCYGHGDEH